MTPDEKRTHRVNGGPKPFGENCRSEYTPSEPPSYFDTVDSMLSPTSAYVDEFNHKNRRVFKLVPVHWRQFPVMKTVQWSNGSNLLQHSTHLLDVLRIDKNFSFLKLLEGNTHCNPYFWESGESEPKASDYFVDSIRLLMCEIPFEGFFSGFEAKAHHLALLQLRLEHCGNFHMFTLGELGPFGDAETVFCGFHAPPGLPGCGVPVR